MAFMDAIIVLLVIFGLFIIGYCAITKRTLTDLILEIRDLFARLDEVPKPK